MTSAYPLSFRTVLASKSRSQPAQFTISSPRRGMAYVQQIGTDIPVFWDVTFRFTTDEAKLFHLWFVTVINKGVDEFTMPIRTEFGMIEHTCRFLPDSLMPANDSGDVWSYTATITSKKLNIPAPLEEAGPIIIELLPDWEDGGSIIDEAMTLAMPGA